MARSAAAGSRGSNPRVTRADIANRFRKKQAASRRQVSHLARLRASVGEEGVLEGLAVGEATARDYSRRLDKFFPFVAKFSLPTNEGP